MSTLVISLCDYTGNMVRPWAQAGCECWIVDVQHSPGVSRLEDNIRKVGCDVADFKLPGKPVILFAFPPCTHLAVSGARHFRAKGLHALSSAIRIVADCLALCESSGAPYMIENPISTLSTYWREPDYKFDPHEYAGYLPDPSKEAYTKKTCLWVGNGFRMPLKKPVAPALGSKMHRLSPSPERANLRSQTPEGFARAVFESNHMREPALTGLFAEEAS